MATPRSTQNGCVVADGAIVGGDLRYRADARLGEVQVDGVSIELGQVPTPIRVKTLLLLVGLLAAPWLVCSRCCMFWLAPGSVRHATEQVSGWRWMRALVSGVAVVLVPPAVFAGLAIGAAISSPDLVVVVVVVLLPFVAIWVAVLVAALLVVRLRSPWRSAVVSRRIARCSCRCWLGSWSSLSAWRSQSIGAWVAALAWLTGLGAWVLGLGSRRRSMPQQAALGVIPSRSGCRNGGASC